MPCASRFGMMRAAPVPWERRGYGAPSPLCVYELVCQPPAHCRLVSGHDPCGMAAFLIVPRRASLKWLLSDLQAPADKPVGTTEFCPIPAMRVRRDSGDRTGAAESLQCGGAPGLNLKNYIRVSVRLIVRFAFKRVTRAAR